MIEVIRYPIVGGPESCALGFTFGKADAKEISVAVLRDGSCARRFRLICGRFGGEFESKNRYKF